ncbi:hypothetical protein DI243_01280 [Paenibacillus polymyxa]|nr:hypothetical protein DI243_01280 [Paenibacillus polymyxa]
MSYVVHPPSSSLFWLSAYAVALRKEGFLVNHKKVYRLMRKWGIQSVIRIYLTMESSLGVFHSETILPSLTKH